MIVIRRGETQTIRACDAKPSPWACDAKPSPRGKGRLAAKRREGKGYRDEVGTVLFFILSAKSDEMFAYPIFTRVPLPPTAQACGSPPSPEGTAFCAHPFRFLACSGFFLT